MKFASALSVLVALAAAPLKINAGQETSRSAVPVEPIAAIIDAFRSHQIVALGAGTENNEQSPAFWLALVRDPRFADAVNDIVVEFGSARYQDVMDRYIHGEEVPDAQLRHIWQDTTQPNTLWDVPVYEGFFRGVRQVNASLPRQRQIRVLLGDPPIDWDRVHSRDDYRALQLDRDGYPADVIRREVLANGRRALVIYGDLHFIRKNPRPTDDTNASARSIVTLLEDSAQAKVFSIRTIAYGFDLSTLQRDVASWPRPSLAMLNGTVLGTTSFSTYFSRPLVVGPDGRPAAGNEPSHSPLMQEQFDAIVYLAPQSAITRSQLAPALCADRAYMAMRIGRMKLLGMDNEIARLNQHCASTVK